MLDDAENNVLFVRKVNDSSIPALEFYERQFAELHGNT